MGNSRGDEDFRRVGVGNSGAASTSFATPIDSSNIGFQLLKKHGWKEGTGLGVSEQGTLEPIQAYLKKNKRGLGADKVKTTPKHSKTTEKTHTDGKSDDLASRNKAKNISKRMKKMQEFEKRLQEKEFERAFFREFWPDNV